MLFLLKLDPLYSLCTVYFTVGSPSYRTESYFLAAVTLRCHEDHKHV